MISVCIPVLTAYDELYKCIDSINGSSIKIDNIYIIDNGGKFAKEPQENLHIYTPNFNIGVAASWNWFIANVPEVRIITNDDVVFDKNAINIMVEHYDENNLVYPNGIDGMNSFSCFILPQNIINTVGLFDEWISPNYGYFEDNDYSHRMSKAGFGLKACPALVYHAGSSTIREMNRIQREQHHTKFKLARDRYKKKWGGEPGHETR